MQLQPTEVGKTGCKTWLVLGYVAERVAGMVTGPRYGKRRKEIITPIQRSASAWPSAPLGLVPKTVKGDSEDPRSLAPAPSLGSSNVQ